jgi:predicted PurR-regulated permease PerM
MRQEKSPAPLRILVGLAATVLVIAGLRAASNIFLPVLVAAFLTIVALPLLDLLRSWRVPRGLAVPLVVAVEFSALAGLVMLVGTSFQDFVAAAPRYEQQLINLWGDGLDGLARLGISDAKEVASDLVNPGAVLNVVTGTVRGVAGVLSQALLVGLLTVLILFEAEDLTVKMGLAFGSSWDARSDGRMRKEIQRYVAVKTLISAATGVVVGLSMALLGIDFAILWGVLAFLLNYIPNLGSLLAAIPPVLLALIQYGLGRALVVVVVFVAVNLLLGSLAEPYFMGRRLGLSTLVVFLSLLFWGWVWGPVGMVLSIPLTVVVKIVLENNDSLRWLAVLLGPRPPEAG